MLNISKFLQELLVFRDLVKKEFPEKDAGLLESLIEQLINVVSRHIDIMSIQNLNSTRLSKDSYEENEIRSVTKKTNAVKMKKRLSKRCSTTQRRGSNVSKCISSHKLPDETCKEMFRLKECYVHLERLNDIVIKGKLPNCHQKNHVKPCFVKLKPLNLNLKGSLSDCSAINEAPQRTKTRLRKKTLSRRSTWKKKIERVEGISDTYENYNVKHQPRSSKKIDVGNPIEEDEDDRDSFFLGFNSSTDLSNHRYDSLISILTNYSAGIGSPLKTINGNSEKFQEFKTPKKPLRRISHLEVENRRPMDEDRPSIYNNGELARKYGELQNLLNLINLQSEKVELLNSEIEVMYKKMYNICKT